MDSDKIKKRKPNPREKASFLSTITFSYAIPTITGGLKQKLQEYDLLQILPEAKSSTLGDKLEKAWYHQRLTTKSNENPSLWKALFKVFLKDILLILLLAMAGEVVGISQPIFCGKLLEFFIPGQNKITKNMAYVYGCGIFISTLIYAILVHNSMMVAYHTAMKMKIAIGSLIYRKILKLNLTSLTKTHAGHIINMLSNDINQLNVVLVDPLYLLLGPLQCLVCFFLLYREIAVLCVTGILILVAFAPLQVFLGYIIRRYQKKAAIKTDERTKLINEVISGMQVIKMFTWEDIFSKSVINARRSEMNSANSKWQVSGIIESFFMFSTRLAIFGTVLTDVILGYSATPQKIFVIYAFYNVLRQGMTFHFPESITTVAQAHVSIKRFRDFLLIDESLPDLKRVEHTIRNDIFTRELSNLRRHIHNQKEEQPPHIQVRNASAKWNPAETKEAIESVSLDVKCSGVTALFGSVGSGKTSLLQIILKELPICSGSVQIVGEVSYASQEPWLFVGTVRQNILFGLPMNEPKYQNVIKVCALQRDINLLPYGDLTLVGEKGFSLSGGQRARINLARTIYKDADIYLLDDPLAAVDSNVAKHIFEHCICNYLRHKIVILSTNQLQLLKEVDHIVYLENGVVREEGSYQQLMNSNLNLKSFLKENTLEESYDERQMLTKPDITSKDKSFKAEQRESETDVDITIYAKYFGASRSCCLIFTVTTFFLVTQFVASFSDYMLAFWAKTDHVHIHISAGEVEKFSYTHVNSSNSSSNNIDDVRFEPIKIVSEDKSNLTGFVQENLVFIIYSTCCILLVVLSFIRSSLFYFTIKRISTTLHNDMFKSILRATMRFFTINDSGRLLNRFSNDIGIVDEKIPTFMMKSLQLLLSCAGTLFLVACVDLWFLFPVILLITLVLLLRWIYLKASRTVTSLERTTRSPVYGHVNATLQGLTTIRAFRREKILIEEFDNLQDLNSSALYTFIVITRAFGYWIDMLTVIFTASIVLSYLIFNTDTSMGNIGLAVTQAISLSRLFQWGIRMSADMENLMMSVERILEYNSVEHEISPKQFQPPPENWPQYGKIEFQKVYMSYFPDDPPVLYNLNCVINPKEKIGIVGRTGAGKSSLIASLFQLSNIEGCILIDNIDITKIPLSQLRSKISIIPQQPVLFSGSLRQNLDPFSKYNDTDIWAALEAVELKGYIMNLNKGLEFQVYEGGTNFSTGQRQLLCLARALLCKNNILIMDEATANIDQQTDNLIQKTIRKNFSNSTVLTIAHRLNTIIDSDRVLVMDAGRIVEFDHAYILLQNKFGYFYEMVNGTGNVRELYDSAKKSYEKENIK